MNAREECWAVGCENEAVATLTMQLDWDQTRIEARVCRWHLPKTRFVGPAHKGEA